MTPAIEKVGLIRLSILSIIMTVLLLSLGILWGQVASAKRALSCLEGRHVAPPNEFIDYVDRVLSRGIRVNACGQYNKALPIGQFR